jgi:chemotaxis receptor (MCP) glutamine deamidase CheD
MDIRNHVPGVPCLMFWIFFDVNAGASHGKRGMGDCNNILVLSLQFMTREKNAWMSHVMLPGQAPQKSGEKPRYAADNTGRLFNQQMESGSVIGNMEVYLVRTGNILRKEDDTI